jgi:hypothetical protein
MEDTKPYNFIGFGAMEDTKPYKFTGFGAMEVTKPYELIGFGARPGPSRPQAQMIYGWSTQHVLKTQVWCPR